MITSNHRPVIGIVGCFQNGKSTLVNCLLDDKVAKTGDGRSTTHLPTVFTFGEFQEAEAIDTQTGTSIVVPFSEYLHNGNNNQTRQDAYHVKLWKPLLQHVDIADTPGFNANSDDDETAVQSLDGLDVVVFVIQNKSLSEIENSVLQKIAEKRLPFLVVMNCIDTFGALWNPASEANARIASEIEARLRNIGHAPTPIDSQFVYPLNLAWFWYASGHMEADENQATKRLIREIDTYFELEAPERRSNSHLAEMSNFSTFRRHLQLIANNFGFRRRPEGETANHLIDLSCKMLQKNDKDSAMLFAERACYCAPGYHPALQNRASICFAREEFDDSIHAATRALDIDARDMETLYLRASAHFAKGEYKSARKDLELLANLLESDWHIAWNEEDKAKQARKYVETYLMKMECDQREGKADDALAAIRHIIYCDQQPLKSLDDSELHQIVWCLDAGLEYRADDYEKAMYSAGIATEICVQTDGASERLSELSKWFKLQNAKFSVCNPNKSLNDEIQRILWKAALHLYGSNLKEAVNAFVDHNHLPISQSTWQDEPTFIPHFISQVGSNSETFDDIKIFVEQYFQVSNDLDLNGFCQVAKVGLRGEILRNFQEASQPLCTIKVSTMLLGNSVIIINTGNPLLSELIVKVSYRLNEELISKELRLNKTLRNSESHCWQDVFEGKSAFGDLFGGKKLTDVKIRSLDSKQGPVKFSILD